MNGLRRNMSCNISILKDVVEAVIKDQHFDKDDLIDAMNDVIRDSNVLNCVFSKDDPDFSDMGNLEVEHIER